MNKKTELKRLLIFLAFAFGISWAIFLAYSLTGHTWDSEDPLSSIAGLGMLAPFAANLLTRWVTKEGFAMTGKASLMLGISFKNRKWCYFLLAVLLPWIYFEINYALMLAVSPKAFDGSYYEKLGVSRELVFLYPLAVIISCSVASFAALGEEGGWRGYMMPKLINLVGMKRAIPIGGIIWGLWHAPLTCAGHNFGTEYPGFPYLGILLMCIFCTALGVILTFLTVKSGSIWPAALMHAVNNGKPAILQFFIHPDKVTQTFPDSITTWLFLAVPVAVLSVLFFLLLNKSKEA